MPEAKITRVYYEGNDDRVVLEQHQAGGLLPDHWEIANRSKEHGGKEGMVHELAPFLWPVGGSAVALVDLDDLRVDQIGPWFRNTLAKELPKSEPPPNISESESKNPRLSCFQVAGGDRSGRVVVVSVGLPEAEELRQEYQIEKFAIDDYLLRFARDPNTYAAMPDFGDVPHAKAMNKLKEFAALLRNNALPIRNSKRFLYLLRAITDFRPSSAEFVKRLLGKALDKVGKEPVRDLFRPLLDDLHEAAGLLTT